jgi:YjbR
MTANAFRRIALSFEGAAEGAHMSHPDFRVNNRIFASLHSENQFGMVKLTPEQQRTFIEDHPEGFAPESGAWGRSGCTRVVLKAAEADMVGEALTLAWQNIKSKRKTS